MGGLTFPVSSGPGCSVTEQGKLGGIWKGKGGEKLFGGLPELPFPVQNGKKEIQEGFPHFTIAFPKSQSITKIH